MTNKRLDLLWWVVIVLNSILVIYHAAGIIIRFHDPGEEKTQRQEIVKIDGCEYIIRSADHERGLQDVMAHKGDCRNPVHWSHVLSDTSWYGSVRRDSNLEIHIQKGASDGEEGKAVR
jgi:hypothetical protein